MGKAYTFISVLIFIDILFLATGQLIIDSPSSVIIQTIQNPSSLKDFSFWSILITGLSALAVVATVVVGFVSRQSDILIFITMGTSLALLIGDYITIFNYLYSINQVFATICFVPAVIMFGFVIVEWVRGKD